MENHLSNKRRAWHKPQVQKLTINVDTQFLSSGTDPDFAGDG